MVQGSPQEQQSFSTFGIEFQYTLTKDIRGVIDVI
jgi:hypothetical protein